MHLISHGISDTGCVRSQNEDRMLCDDNLGLYVVCDGIGGRRGGEVAAEIATHAIHDFVESSTDPAEFIWPFGYNARLSLAGNRISTAVSLACREVWRRAQDSLQYLGMGTTITAVLANARHAAVANVGDSRVYLYRNLRLDQLSVDDAASMQMAAMDGRTGVERSVLTRAAGSEEDVEVHLRELELLGGDVLLLCSDGLHGFVPKEAVAAALASSGSLAERAEALIASARSAGAPDNVSALLVQVQPS